MLKHLAAIRHIRWWEDAAAGSPVKDLVRIFKDMRVRFQGLKPLSVWAIEFLCHFCMVHTANRQTLPMGPTFLRVLQLLAAGVFLPGSIGLADPCDIPSNFLSNITFEEMDSLCSTAQTLVRVISHGGHARVMGTSPENIDVTVTPTYYMVDGERVVVTPLDKAYDPTLMTTQKPAGQEAKAAAH
ncbi:unnamed protein product, partial [Mesorhabditis spiculigera]